MPGRIRMELTEVSSYRPTGTDVEVARLSSNLRGPRPCLCSCVRGDMAPQLLLFA